MSWFDHAMDDLSTSYRKQTQKWAWIAAVLMAVTFNVDTVHTIETLWHNPTLSVRISAAAQGAVAQGDKGAAGDTPASQDLTKRATDAVAQANELDLPVGWTAAQRDGLKSADVKWLALKLLGLALSTIALSLGAPFWFDVLNRIVGLRKGLETAFEVTARRALSP